MVPLSAVIAIVGMLVAIVGTLIVVNLHSIKGSVTDLGTRLQKQDESVSTIAHSQAAITIEAQRNQTECKVDCEREFVRSEVFLRETGFLRRSLDSVSAATTRIEGNLKVVELLPQICGDIARKIVHEFKENGDNPNASE
jgi:hypothetical protein